MIGIVVIIRVFASSTPIAFESESGTLAGCANTITDSAASSGSAVKFDSCTSGTTGPLALDASGSTIPDTDYAIPAGAIFMATTGSDSATGTQSAPVKTLNQAINLVPAGGTIVIRGGDYRDWYNNGSGNYKIATKSITFQAYPHEQAWFDGADVEPTINWASDGSGHYAMNWSTPSFCSGNYYQVPYNAQNSNNTGPCTHIDMANTPGYGAAGDPQMLFVDGTQIPEVASLSSVTAGSFYYDWTNKKIYMGTNPSGHTVELAARPVALILGNATYGIKGIGFKRYATNEDATNSPLTAVAVYITGTNSVVQDSVFTQMATQGLSLDSAGGAVRNSVFADNGMNGMGSFGTAGSGGTDNVDIEGNVFNRLNQEHFGVGCTLSCAASAVKLAYLNGWTFKNNVIENLTDGTSGIWCDTDCSSGVVADNLILGSGGSSAASGIDFEKNNSGIDVSNIVVGFKYGIDIGSSNVQTYNNTVVNSPTISYRVYDDNRLPHAANVMAGNNIFYGTSALGLWTAAYNGNGASNFITELDYDAYYRTSNLVAAWTDSSSSYYSSVAALTTAHGFESHGLNKIPTDPLFVNLGSNNFNLVSNSASYQSGGAIPADVAAAAGISTAAGQNRGALIWPGHS